MKKTHKMRKIMLALFSAMLLVCVTVGATVAYLTSTDEVVNTFTPPFNLKFFNFFISNNI